MSIYFSSAYSTDSAERKFLLEDYNQPLSKENMETARAAMGSLQLATNFRMLNEKPQIGHRIVDTKILVTELFLGYELVKGFPTFLRKLERFQFLIIQRIKNGIFRQFIGVSKREQNFFPMLMVSNTSSRVTPSSAQRTMW